MQFENVNSTLPLTGEEEKHQQRMKIYDNMLQQFYQHTARIYHSSNLTECESEFLDILSGEGWVEAKAFYESDCKHNYINFGKTDEEYEGFWSLAFCYAYWEHDKKDEEELNAWHYLVQKAVAQKDTLFFDSEDYTTVLHHIAYFKENELTLELLDCILKVVKPEDLNMYDIYGKTPLLEAISSGNEKVALRLLDNPYVDVNLYRIIPILRCPTNIKPGLSTYRAALELGINSVVDKILGRGDYDPTFPYTDATTDILKVIFFGFVVQGNMDTLKVLLRQYGPDIFGYICPSSKWTMLHVASYAGNLQVIEFLLNLEGINKAFNGMGKFTKEDHKEFVNAISAYGASAFSRGMFGNRGLMRNKVRSLFLKCPSFEINRIPDFFGGNSILHDGDYNSIIQAAKRPDVNFMAKDLLGLTPIEIAYNEKNIPLMKLLVKIAKLQTFNTNLDPSHYINATQERERFPIASRLKDFVEESWFGEAVQVFKNDVGTYLSLITVEDLIEVLKTNQLMKVKVQYMKTKVELKVAFQPELSPELQKKLQRHIEWCISQSENLENTTIVDIPHDIDPQWTRTIFPILEPEYYKANEDSESSLSVSSDENTSDLSEDLVEKLLEDLSCRNLDWKTISFDLQGLQGIEGKINLSVKYAKINNEIPVVEDGTIEPEFLKALIRPFKTSVTALSSAETSLLPDLDDNEENSDLDNSSVENNEEIFSPRALPSLLQESRNILMQEGVAAEYLKLNQLLEQLDQNNVNELNEAAFGKLLKTLSPPIVIKGEIKNFAGLFYHRLAMANLERVNHQSSSYKDQGRFDALARLMEGGGVCVATCFDIDELLISGNFNVQNTNKTELMENVISYLKTYVEGNVDDAERLKLIIQSIVPRVKRFFTKENDDLEPFVKAIIPILEKNYNQIMTEWFKLDEKGQLEELCVSKILNASNLTNILKYPNRAARTITETLRIMKDLREIEYSLLAPNDFLAKAILEQKYQIIKEGGKDVHAEMRIINYLYAKYKNNLPRHHRYYIGISKLSCTHCNLVFALSTHFSGSFLPNWFNFSGAHSVPYEWAVPDFLKKDGVQSFVDVFGQDLYLTESFKELWNVYEKNQKGKKNPQDNIALRIMYNIHLMHTGSKEGINLYQEWSKSVDVLELICSPLFPGSNGEMESHIFKQLTSSYLQRDSSLDFIEVQGISNIMNFKDFMKYLCVNKFSLSDVQVDPKTEEVVILHLNDKCIEILDSLYSRLDNIGLLQGLKNAGQGYQ
ncbi:MAG: hypothetical protein K0R73_1011 [Candidatus Midichloriaceae bacterium]|jgi:ankyrin repeat protein|nr:hypothetical protein [Candidatus Midichloriaceae bacterium]